MTRLLGPRKLKMQETPENTLEHDRTQRPTQGVKGGHPHRPGPRAATGSCLVASRANPAAVVAGAAVLVAGAAVLESSCRRGACRRGREQRQIRTGNGSSGAPTAANVW